MKEGCCMKQLKEIIFNKNPLLIMSYLSRNKTQENISAHIAKELELGAGSVHQILKQFEDKGVVIAKRLGKTILYELDKRNPLVKTFRVFDNLLDLDSLFICLKTYCRKIILFGSCATGTDTNSSDIDLFIVADEDDKDNVQSIISNYYSTREIKPIIVDTIELMELENSDKVFYNEVMKGIEIWERDNGYNC